ncbi:MAG TPA: 5'/3'-nucleotidase SurE [Thermoanaerobaculia bacterium]|nr:5'/3'-nucleotidase SurE [Thermoanaerobaculia bacterium]
MARILVTNDDGVSAEGLLRLQEVLADIDGTEVIVVAPDREQSATSHSLTLHRPLRLKEVSAGRYSVDGTPTDCVSLAVFWLMKGSPPDLIVSGINSGLNLGDDVTYSGTVSATFEGALLGIPSVAFSQDISAEFSFERAAGFARRLVRSLLAHPLPEGLLLNVNLPAGQLGPVRLTRLGSRVYRQSVIEKTDPRGRRYFWIAGTPEWRHEEGTDHAAVAAGEISVTPLHLDLTDYERLNDPSGLNRWLLALEPEPSER